MSTRSDFAALLRDAERAGCVVDRRRRHLRIQTPSGARLTASRSASDVNAVHALRRDLVRAGVAL